ncbi:hypothetical protein BDR05DRAFT_875104, partial [Suillus weaverae]
SQHKHVGTRHFHDGVSHVNQMIRCEHRDIQRMLVPTIAGVTSHGLACAIHALIDFIYKAQAPTFTRSSLDSMVSFLNEFHTYKHFILEAEARMETSGPISHFQIPKLESFNSFTCSVQQSGALIQHSVDVSERLLITHCKMPFQRISTFTQQIVNIINHEDVMRQFDLYTLLCEQGISLINVMDNEFDEAVDMDPTFSWIACIAPQEMHRFQAIHPVHNHFLKGLLSDEANAAFHITIAHDLANRQNSLYHGHLLKTWYKFRLQLHSRLHPCNITPSQQVQAYPPSDTYPFGNCDIVLLQPTYGHPKSCKFSIQHSFYPTSDGSPSCTRIGKIVQLVDVTHAVELILIYGTTMDRSVSLTMSLECYDNFYLNAFSDKEWYHTLHADFV